MDTETKDKLPVAIKGVIETGRFRIPYRIYGNGEPQIVCINGVQQSMAMWHSFVLRYASRYRIILFDYPNQGKGEVLSGQIFVSLDEQVDILRAVIKTTDANKDLTICSASWGGIVAMIFASRYPDAVKKLCLASLGTRANDKMIETIKEGFRIDPNNRQKMADVLIGSFGENLPDDIKRKIIKQFHDMSEEKLRSFYEYGELVLSTGKLGDLIKFSDVAAKTFLIYGEKDSIIDFQDVNFLASQIPHCELKIVKGAGHFLHMERNEIFDVYDDILLKP